MRASIFPFALGLVLAASIAAANPEVAVPLEPTVPPDIACAKLCGDLYSETEKRTLCEEGCESAAACVKKCEDEFPEDDARARCTYRCARAR